MKMSILQLVVGLCFAINFQVQAVSIFDYLTNLDMSRPMTEEISRLNKLNYEERKVFYESLFSFKGKKYCETMEKLVPNCMKSINYGLMYLLPDLVNIDGKRLLFGVYCQDCTFYARGFDVDSLNFNLVYDIKLSIPFYVDFFRGLFTDILSLRVNELGQLVLVVLQGKKCWSFKKLQVYDIRSKKLLEVKEIKKHDEHSDEEDCSHPVIISLPYNRTIKIVKNGNNIQRGIYNSGDKEYEYFFDDAFVFSPLEILLYLKMDELARIFTENSLKNQTIHEDYQQVWYNFTKKFFERPDALRA